MTAGRDGRLDEPPVPAPLGVGGYSEAIADHLSRGRSQVHAGLGHADKWHSRALRAMRALPRSLVEQPSGCDTQPGCPGNALTLGRGVDSAKQRASRRMLTTVFLAVSSTAGEGLIGARARDELGGSLLDANPLWEVHLDSLDCSSPSISRTSWPRAASTAAIFTASSVLPTPALGMIEGQDHVLSADGRRLHTVRTMGVTG
jgi:hypothetical protein